MILHLHCLCTLVYLLSLVLSTVILASDSLLETTFFLWPVNTLLKRFWDDQIFITPHPYVLHGVFFVLGVTLFLFFASGLYSEKITYANKYVSSTSLTFASFTASFYIILYIGAYIGDNASRYVPHANRTLRSFNMYLNVRTQSTTPLRSVFPFFFSESTATSMASQSTGKADPYGRDPTGPYPIIPPIPPSQNPRGELIFSSRVEKSFRERYEYYREGFEKRRTSPASSTGSKFLEWLGIKCREGSISTTVSGDGESRAETPVLEGARRGRLGSMGTNDGSRSRRGSPAPTGKRGSTRKKKTSIRSGTPLLEIAMGAGAPRGGTPVSAELGGIAETRSEKVGGSRSQGGSSTPTRLTPEQTLSNEHELQIGSGARHFNSTSFGMQGESSI